MSSRRFDALVLDADPSDLSVFDRPQPATAVFKAGRSAFACERLGLDRELP